MQTGTRFFGAGVAAAVAAGVGYALLTRRDDEPAFDTIERDGSISVRDYPALRVGVLRVTGEASDAVLDDQQAALHDWLHVRGYRPVGPAATVTLEKPLTPTMLQATEIRIPLA